MTIDVVIPSYAVNETKRILLQQTIDSLRACESEAIQFVICVLDKTPDLDVHGADIVTSYDFPFNFNKVLNHGARMLSSEYVLFSNDDVIYYKGFIEELLEGIKRGYASVSPNDLGKRTRRIKRFEEGYDIDIQVKGWSYLISRASLEKIGYMDEGVTFWYSDYVYIDQLVFHKMAHCLCSRAFAHHLGKSSYEYNPNNSDMTMGQAKVYANVRLKYVPDKEWTIRNKNPYHKLKLLSK